MRSFGTFASRAVTERLITQDTTTRIWDIRQPGKSLAVLNGRMGAVRSLRFSSDGRFLAMAEPADFVHVFDVKAGFQRCASRRDHACCRLHPWINTHTHWHICERY